MTIQNSMLYYNCKEIKEEIYKRIDNNMTIEYKALAQNR